MMRGLIAKELRQHRMLLIFLFFILAGGLVLIAGNTMLERAGGSGFFAVRLMLFTFLPLSCLVLCHSLIATEFRQKTQLFLEGLPLPRWRMLLVKYALGLTLLLVAMATSLVVAWWPARGSEAMTPRFAALLLLKTAGWTWFLFALFYTHAFLGRYRIAFAVLVLLVFTFLDQIGVETSVFGPFQLVDERFPYERDIFPVEAFWHTAAFAIMLTILGFSLGLIRDATVASLLAEKMSSREKVFTTFVILAALMTTGYLDEKLKSATPVRLPGASEGIVEGIQVFASAAVDAPSREETAALEKIAHATADDLAAIATFLHSKSLPPLFIVHRRDLKPNDFQNGALKRTQGLMVRVNLTAPELQHERLRFWIIANLLHTHTNGLAGRERNAWVLDGFPGWWIERYTRDAKPDRWNDVTSGAAAALPKDFSADHVRRWLSVRRDIGLDPAQRLAATGIAALAQSHGEQACRQFLADSLGRRWPADARGWFRDVIDPMSNRLRRAAGVSLDGFVNEWRASLLPVPSPAPTRP